MATEEEEGNKQLESLEFPQVLSSISVFLLLISTFQIFEEDVVCAINRPKKIGVVAAVQWESDDETSDDEEDEDEEDESDDEVSKAFNLINK